MNERRPRRTTAAAAHDERLGVDLAHVGEEIPVLRPRAGAYIALLVLFAVGAAAISSSAGPPLDARNGCIAAALAALLIGAYRHPLSFGPHTHLLLDTTGLLSAALLLPPELAVPVALATPLLANLPRRHHWSQGWFNGSQAAMQVIAAQFVLAVCGWNTLAPFADARFLFSVPLAGLAMYLVNTAAIAGIQTLQEGWRFFHSWRRLLIVDRTEACGMGVQWGMALLAVIVADGHPWGLILLGMPSIVVFAALEQNVRLRLRAEEQVIYQAFHDSLTGLPNRTSLMESLNAALGTVRTGSGCAALFVDLDRFKLINDTFGHDAGDRVLTEIALRLRSCVRPGDLVARLGGDEFVVIVNGISGAAEAMSVAHRAIDTLTRWPVSLAGQDVQITASVGIAIAGPRHRTASDLLREADHALYSAKESGRARYVLFPRSIPTTAGECLSA